MPTHMYPSPGLGALPESGEISALLGELKGHAPPPAPPHLTGQTLKAFFDQVNWRNAEPKVSRPERARKPAPGSLTVRAFLAATNWKNQPNAEESNHNPWALENVLAEFVWD